MTLEKKEEKKNKKKNINHVSLPFIVRNIASSVKSITCKL